MAREGDGAMPLPRPCIENPGLMYEIDGVGGAAAEGEEQRDKFTFVAPPLALSQTCRPYVEEARYILDIRCGGVTARWLLAQTL